MSSAEIMRNYVEARSIPEPMSGCWIWLASLGSHGYGNACIANKATVAHRFSYEAFIGPIPAGMLIQHSCDNHWCVAPHHLSIGTDATNALDKMRKGRAAKKLTDRDVRAIRARIEVGADADEAIGGDFGVHKSMVARIRRGLAWRHVS
jgi:hypothetical protein